MSRSISVRLDEAAEQDLVSLEAAGFSQSDAVRTGLKAAAARLRQPHALAAEARALADDEEDRAEAAAVGELMEELRAPW